MSDSLVAQTTESPVWIVEGVVDVPCQMPLNLHAENASLFVALGGDRIDGFVQLRPKDSERSSNPVFWSERSPLLFDCRAAVEASDAAAAILRAQVLYEHVADRLTLLTGYPCRVISIGFAYNEMQVVECANGARADYDATTGGDDAFRIGPIKNANLPQLLHPPEAALEAIRWFRHAMIQQRPIDQFLSYYIALESISRHVPGVQRGPKRGPDGEEIDGLESVESAGIRHLAMRHPSLPTNTRQELARIRAQIAHGSTNPTLLLMAFNNLPLVQRLAADGIALVVGVSPESLQFLRPSFVSLIVPILKGQFQNEDHPILRWGVSLSQCFQDYSAAQGRDSNGDGIEAS